MTITKTNYKVLKNAALYAAKNEPIFADSVNIAIETTEQAAADHNKKVSAYILEKRKNNKYYCR